MTLAPRPLHSQRWNPRVTSAPFRMTRSSLGLLVGLDEPQPFVHAARDFGEQVGGVAVAEAVGLSDRLADRRAERGQGARQGFNVATAVHRFRRVLAERTP